MKESLHKKGSVFIVTIFVIALMAALVMGMLQINTEEIQLMQNQINAAQAVAVAEAGLNDAFKEIRSDSSWTDGFSDKAFNSHSYTVSVSGALPNRSIRSTGTTEKGFVAVIDANVTIAASSPYTIRIDDYKINGY